MVWSYPDDGRLYLVLSAGLAGLLVLAFRFASASTARSKVLVGLRAATLAILVLILLNPTRVEETQHKGPEPPAVFLVDESRSMSLERPVSRAAAALRLIERAQASVPPEAQPAVLKFGFGRDLLALSEPRSPRQPTADETRLVRSLEQLPDRFGESLPYGVFVFSDGRSTEPEEAGPIARAYRQLGVPVHVAPVGDERISGDVAIEDIDAPRDARAGSRVPVRVTVRSRGYDGERTELRIRSAANPRDLALATLPVTLTGGEQAHELVIDTDRAKGPLTAEVSLLPREAIAANNTVGFQISPREAKIRVIYMEGSALPEYRFLQDALEEDPNIKCLSMYVDNQYVASPALHRINDPTRGFPTTREELLSYDVVICSDIARSAFTQQQLEWTVELVNKRGGGFVMIGGHTSFGSGGWDQTIWDGLIPVDMSGRGASRSEYYDGAFRIVIPAQAIDHPIWRIVEDRDRNRRVLEGISTFYGTNLTDRLKPAATALGLSERPLVGSKAVTIFSCQSFGRGRTFAMATDTTIAWGTDFEKSWGEGDNRYYRKFWRNVVRWLTENSDGANRRLRIETDKIIYRPGQEIQVAARAYDEKLEQTDRYRLVARVRAPSEPDSPRLDASAASLVAQLGEPIYRGRLTTPQAGANLGTPGSTIHPLLLDVTALDGANVMAQVSAELQLIDDPAEFRDPRPDLAHLKEIAEATGGHVIRSPTELASLLAQHPRASIRKVITHSPLWDSPLLWLLVLVLLSTEWIVRRLKGLA